MPFPLPFVPKLSYKTGGRRFGAPRDEGRRKHAGCDLIAPEGTPVFAIDDGVIIDPGLHIFYRGTYAVVVQHKGYTVRYCELRQNQTGLKRGDYVTAGTIIGHVGRMYRSSMLHFELYRRPAIAGPLTVRGAGPFQRRADLADPTRLLDRLSRHVLVSHPPVFLAEVA